MQQVTVETVQVLESKRIGEMAVGISSLKFTAEETVEALQTVDLYVLDEETLHKLLRICPTAEEQKLLIDNKHRIHLLTQQE